MDDIQQLTSQAQNELDSLAKSICSGNERVALSHVLKPRACAEHLVIPDAIHTRVSQLRPATKVFYIASQVESAIRRYMASTTDAFMEILIKTRMKEQSDKKRYRLAVPSSEDEQGSSIEGIAETEEDTSPEEVVIIVELDPELSPDFALFMVLLRQRADDLVLLHPNSKWRMHIVTISNETFDPRIDRLCLPQDRRLRHWCFPRNNTYTLEWARHGTVGDTPLKTLVSSSSGRITTMMFRTEDETHDITSLVEGSILNDDTGRLLVICFEPWVRIKELLHSLEGHEQAIKFDYYTEEEKGKHEAASIVREKVKILERTNLPQTTNGFKLVFVLFLMNGSSNVMMKTIDSMSDWSTITILGTQQTSRFLDINLNHTAVVVPKFPCPEEQLDQLSWVRRCDTKGIVIVTGKDPRMLRDNWGSYTMDNNVRKVLFPKPEFEKRLVEIENDKMAGFYCAVVALDAIFGIHAHTVFRTIGLRANARIATIKSLRYQGILGESPGTESEPMRLRLEPLVENEQESHSLFLGLLRAFGYDHKLAVMVYKSLSCDQNTRVLTIRVACTLKIGLEELINTEQFVEVAQTDGGLETLFKMCTGSFRKLARTGTLWLKLALVHKIVWIDGELGSYYDGTLKPKFFETIVHVGDHEYPIRVSSDACIRIDNLINLINSTMSNVVGKTPRPSTNWYVPGSESTLLGVQRNMLEGHVLDIVLSRPRTTPSSVLGIRSRASFEFRHEYMRDMAANSARDLPPEDPDMIYGIALSIPVLESSTFYIDEWIMIPDRTVLSWQDLHYGKGSLPFDRLIC